MSILTLVAVIIFLHMIFPSHSYAYLDPGSGSIMLQLLLVAFFSALAAIKVFWGKIKTFFTKNRFSQTENDNDD